MRTATTLVMLMAVAAMCTGCVGRMVSEGMGAARGASGRAVENGATPRLTSYKGLRVEAITIAAGSQAPDSIARMIQADLQSAASKRGLMAEGEPALKLVGEIIHYESSSTMSKAIGPLAEVIVRARLIDAGSGKVVAEANLVGRSKATTSSGNADLAGGVGKALGKWLKAGGVEGEDDEND